MAKEHLVFNLDYCVCHTPCARSRHQKYRALLKFLEHTITLSKRMLMNRKIDTMDVGRKPIANLYQASIEAYSCTEVPRLYLPWYASSKSPGQKDPFFLWYIKNTIIPIEMILNTWSRLFLSKGQNAKEAFTEVNYAHDSSKSSNSFWFVGIRTWNIWSCSIRPTWFIWCKIASMNTTTSCVLLGHHIRQNPVWGYKNRKNKTVESKHAEIALKRLRAHYE